MSETAARARRDRPQQRMGPGKEWDLETNGTWKRMVPGNSADRSVGRDWITQCLSASERPPPSKMECSPPAPNTGAAFPPHDGARLRAAHLSANSGGHPAWERSMSLRPEPAGEIPAETVRVARAAFPKGTLITRLRDEFSALYQDKDFRALYPARGQPGLAPWRLALVTVFQFLEHLSDRQAADALRARIDWKYALGLELTDLGFHFSVLGEFRARLVAGGAEHLLLDTMLERFKARGLVKARGKQRTDSTHVLAAVRDLSFLELVAETLRAALDDVAAVAPDWLRAVAKPVWFERYGRRVEDYRLPKSREEREALALEVGADGFVLLGALDAPDAPGAGRELPMVRTLGDVWRVHYARDDDGRLRWRSVAELPPVAERVQSPYDPEAHFSQKLQFGWTGYKGFCQGSRQ